MDLAAERCSLTSEALAELMLGTASTIRRWLLLEHPGPWGRRALRDARLPDGLGSELRRRARAAGARVLLIRRVGRTSSEGVTCFAIRSGPGEPWIARTRLERIEDALDLDLDRLAARSDPGLEPGGGPVFLVCTHGRRDPCCAERGRPLADTLSRTFPDQTWECSHIGGDRFAGNLVALPHGLYFGRVAPEEGVRVARAYLGGTIDLERFRGRSCYPMDVQAAEHLLRLDRRLVGIDEVVPRTADRSEGELVVTLDAPGGAVRVRVGVGLGPRHRLTCHSREVEPAPSYELLGIEPAA